jgi:hypothetical protein
MQRYEELGQPWNNNTVRLCLESLLVYIHRGNDSTAGCFMHDRES